MTNPKRAFIVLVISAALSAVLNVAGSEQSYKVAGLPIITLCTVWIFTLQWLVFVPSYLAQTEKYFDITGSLTFISTCAIALWFHPNLTLYTEVLAMMVMVWALRLGGFLFLRILQDGTDDRFDEIKPDKYRFFSAWTLQGLWVLLTSSAALLAISTTTPIEPNAITYLGLLIWLIGLMFESIADVQKRQFKKQQPKQTEFITSGLWAYSRHPNYFGEICLWVGIAIACFPILLGWQLVGLISPLFVIVLLTRISGIPLLEAKADSRWGNLPSYQDYRTSTPILIPNLFRKNKPK